MNLVGKKVFVGMSGGVDSSVSALLLKKAGADVTGVFIKVWQPDWLSCTWKEERLDAMRVATHLGIPFVTLDLENEYKKGVVDYMLNEYRLGKTPNPDVMCNKEVKFGGFLDFALKNGADYIATGHYARTDRRERAVNLLEGKDNNKDQSYFLWTLSQRQLERTIFPIGELKKEEVRKIAKKNDIPTAEKKDSQGICFIGKIDFKDFLKHYIKEHGGEVLNTRGEIIGEHDGVEFLTIGERRGFRITKKGTNDPTYYIISKDILKNTLTVSDHKPELVPQSKVNIANVNWCASIPLENKIYEVRLRYRAEKNKCKIILNEANENRTNHKDLIQIIMLDKVSSVALGQSAVIYDDEICIGGGIIS